MTDPAMLCPDCGQPESGHQSIGQLRIHPGEPPVADLTPDTIAAAQEYIPPAETLDEACYLVSRGVRPLALAGVCAATPVVMTRVRTVLHRALQAELTIPFVIPERGNPGIAAFGYAAHRWCVDLLEWATSGEIPPARKHEIIGLLCGYSAPAIARHRELDGARDLLDGDHDA